MSRANSIKVFSTSSGRCVRFVFLPALPLTRTAYPWIAVGGSVSFCRRNRNSDTACVVRESFDRGNHFTNIDERLRPSLKGCSAWRSHCAAQFFMKEVKDRATKILRKEAWRLRRRKERWIIMKGGVAWWWYSPTVTNCHCN